MIIFRSRERLRCQELWFNESERAGKYDIVVRNQSSAPMSGRRSEEFHTLLIDLTPQPQQIFASFDRNTRSQIRAAEADERVTVEIIESASATQLAEFLNFYDDFSRSKSIWPIWAPRLRALHESHRLVLSRVIRDQETLVWHASLRTDERFIVLYSASLPGADQSLRKVIGQANRLLHWREMLCVKDQGCPIYDFCGWYAGVEDKALLLVNRFKEEFGGRKVVEYNIFEDRTIRAKFVRVLKTMMSKFPKERKARWQRLFHAGVLLYIAMNQNPNFTLLSL